MLQHALRYTLGGFYLARYSDSPVGAFDEVDYQNHYTVLTHNNRCMEWMHAPMCTHALSRTSQMSCMQTHAEASNS